MVQLHLQELGLSGPIVLAEGSIDYKLPIAENPRAVCNLIDTEGDFEVLQKGKNARLSMTVALYDGDDFAAMFTGRYVVKAPR